MKITDVKVFPVEEEKLKAYATVTFDNCFIVRDLKVISGNKGYFIAMPSKKRKDGTFRDVAHPLNSETRKMIEDAVLEVYEREAAAGAALPRESDTAEYDSLEPDEGKGSEDPVSEEDNPAEVSAGADEDNPAEVSAGADEDNPAEVSAGADEDGTPPEDEEKNPTDNPTVERTEDPEKAFGYEE
ncbi:MAG: septation regulator SpoVG [bacterium]|nr:MAG: septation regulator SpoVG [bacterium]